MPRKKRKIGLSESTWIETAHAFVNVNKADHVLDRELMPTSSFESQKRAYLDAAGYFDLTANKKSRGVVIFGDYIYTI